MKNTLKALCFVTSVICVSPSMAWSWGRKKTEPTKIQTDNKSEQVKTRAEIRAEKKATREKRRAEAQAARAEAKRARKVAKAQKVYDKALKVYSDIKDLWEQSTFDAYTAYKKNETEANTKALHRAIIKEGRKSNYFSNDIGPEYPFYNAAYRAISSGQELIKQMDIVKYRVITLIPEAQKTVGAMKKLGTKAVTLGKYIIDHDRYQVERTGWIASQPRTIILY